MGRSLQRSSIYVYARSMSLYIKQRLKAEEIEIHIQEALSAAKSEGITGKKVTPFLLKYIADHTKGESLEANIALIKHNAKTGAEIAEEYIKKPI